MKKPARFFKYLIITFCIIFRTSEIAFIIKEVARNLCVNM